MAQHVRWTGESGQQYQTELNPIGAIYRPRSGVYIFCRSSGGGNWDAIYIGETSSFERRLADELDFHHQIDCIRNNGATHVCTIHIPGGLAARERVETDLRRGIWTPCNEQ